jgi:hypothetical protein
MTACGPPKDTPKKAIHALSGSLAFSAGPRLVFIETEEQESDRKLVLAVKNTLGEKATGIGYKFKNAYADRRIKTSKIEWDNDP